MIRHRQPTRPAADAPPRPRRRRGDRGLTTLEWLLIVAAVAGLAALAVVLVQNVVDDTAEQISGSSARVTAARVAAQEITDECISATARATGCDQLDAATVSHVNDAKAKCERLTITYGDALTAANAKVMWFPAADNTMKFGETTVDAKKYSCHIINA